jgi:hypothetical protein
MPCFTLATSYPFSHYESDPFAYEQDPTRPAPVILHNLPSMSSSQEARSFVVTELSKRIVHQLPWTHGDEHEVTSEEEKEEQQQHLVRPVRSLQNFNELNELLKSVTIILPEFSFSAGNYLFAEVMITAMYTKCVDLSIRNLQVLFERQSLTTSTLDVLVDGLGFDCEISWEFVSYLFIFSCFVVFFSGE